MTRDLFSHYLEFYVEYTISIIANSFKYSILKFPNVISKKNALKIKDDPWIINKQVFIDSQNLLHTWFFGRHPAEGTIYS